MSSYKKSRNRVITRRGVLWLGQTCNLHCHFCYFLDRIKNAKHPAHQFMTLEKAKGICKTLVDVYGNNAIDIQGGEPTIYPDIEELVAYCRRIGLIPTLITNALVLSKRDVCARLQHAGLRDFLVSVHGLGETFDEIVGVSGAHQKQMAALDNCLALGIPFRFNCVLSKKALPQLVEIARLAVDTGARVVNFIAFNPFEDQAQEGKRSKENVPSYSEVAPYLSAALDVLEVGNVEANVRYYPMCMLLDRNRKSAYNLQQIPYDIHEWDFASWSWTGQLSQQMRQGKTTRPLSLAEMTYVPITSAVLPKKLALKLRGMLMWRPGVLGLSQNIGRKISRIVNRSSNQVYSEGGKELLYRNNATLRAKVDCGYVYSYKCSGCSLKNICDGFHGDYAELFGVDEARPVILKEQIFDPKYYISKQDKVVDEEDFSWAL